MTEALVISNALLWLLVVALGALVFALTRQIGVLHERVAPLGALAVSKGPAVGDPLPVRTLVDVDGRDVSLGGVDALGRRTLLFFLSPTCPVCETLLPTLDRIIGEESPGLRVVYASDGEPDEHVTFRREHGLEAATYVLSQELGMSLEVARLPYAVLVDAAGMIRAKGIVNTREHIESLFEADRLGVDSIQTYLRREQGPTESWQPGGSERMVS